MKILRWGTMIIRDDTISMYDMDVDCEGAKMSMADITKEIQLAVFAKFQDIIDSKNFSTRNNTFNGQTGIPEDCLKGDLNEVSKH